MLASLREPEVNSPGRTSPTKRTLDETLRTIDGVSPTVQALLFALLGAVLGGGAVLAFRVSERQLRPTGGARAGPAARRGRRALRAAQQRPRRRRQRQPCSRPPRPAIAMGLVRGHEITVRELAELVRQVRRDGQIRETELLMQRDGPAASPRHRAGGAAQLPAGAGARRGPHPRAPGGVDPPRLRGQREPRAEDAGRARSSCSPTRSSTPPTTPRPCSGSPAGCTPRASGSPGWCSRSSSSPACRATTRSTSRWPWRSTRSSPARSTRASPTPAHAQIEPGAQRHRTAWCCSATASRSPWP